ncbi:XdhC family protein [Pseudomonas typographi]|uniref:XdhC family protein n=1 Tax=Pseudomonas typographi TaxID=2715964 RepID=A0ABR7YYA6_9PSED|nr:XdhC family protein [Pseudomonas typographi]MBD1598177.1 XdhC family protein [Pseudomonas typographi]
MGSVDLQVLQNLLDWCLEGRRCVLYTVAQTWGSAPRQPGAMMVLREDGVVCGSASGGCIEADLISRLHDGRLGKGVNLITYGVSREQAARFGLPCGGTLRLVEEPVADAGWVQALLAQCQAQRTVVRELDFASGAVALAPAAPGQALAFDERRLRAVYGPRWRLLLIGAGQLSRCVAPLAQMLDFDVLVCDPRAEFRQGWEGEPVRFVNGMPDDAVLAIAADERTAIVALTHDPRLDDMALLTALESPAFYIGALGSKRNNDKRRQNLAQLGLGAEAIARLHGPVGLPIGSHSPAEIAVSVMAQIVAVRNGVQ